MEIREAIKWANDFKNNFEANKNDLKELSLADQALQTLIRVAERIENVKGLPEKKENYPLANYDVGKEAGYNLAIDDCKLYMAKRDKENDRLKKDIELLELYLKNTRNDVLVLRKQLAKMLDVKRIEKILMDFVHPTMSYDTAKVNWRGLAQAIVNELGKGE